LEELEEKLRLLSIREMNNHNNNILNPPPLFTGIKKELDGFLTRIELIFRNRPDVYNNDRIRLDYVIFYLFGKLLDWAFTLIRNDGPILESYEGFIDNLKNTFGVYCYETIIANGKLDTLKNENWEMLLHMSLNSKNYPKI